MAKRDGFEPHAMSFRHGHRQIVEIDTSRQITTRMRGQAHHAAPRVGATGEQVRSRGDCDAR